MFLCGADPVFGAIGPADAPRPRAHAQTPVRISVRIRTRLYFPSGARDQAVSAPELGNALLLAKVASLWCGFALTNRFLARSSGSLRDRGRPSSSAPGCVGADAARRIGQRAASSGGAVSHTL